MALHAIIFALINLNGEANIGSRAFPAYNQVLAPKPQTANDLVQSGYNKSELKDHKGAIADVKEARQTEAKNYMARINRYSIAYAINQKITAPNLEALKVDDKPKNNTYTYTYQKINQTTTLVTALSTQNNLKTYVGTTVSTDEKTIQSIICETNQKTNLSNLMPKINNSQLTCPVGSSSAF